MRDDRFKAVHRGGSLDLDRHRQLAIWAADCAEHVLPLFEASRPLDDRPRRAIETARAWAAGEISVGAARTAAFAAHAAARDAADAAREAARAAGHAVATAHMADHALGPAWYGVRAVRASAGVEAAERERAWQLEHLSPSIRALVVSALESGKFAR
jgi:Imm-5 like putative immunity protein